MSIFDCSTGIYGRAFVEGAKKPGLISPLNRNYDRRLCHLSFSLQPSSRHIAACTKICCTSSEESSFVRCSIHQHRIPTLYTPVPIHSPFHLARTSAAANLRTRPPNSHPGATWPQASATGGEPHHQAMPRATEAFGASRPSLDKRCPRDSGTPTPATKGAFCWKTPLMSSRTHAPKSQPASMPRYGSWIFYHISSHAGRAEQAHVM